jgi:Predicted nucleoside-diphosphate-sugar epimerases
LRLCAFAGDIFCSNRSILSIMSDARTALLLGATGLVGGHCLELLLKDEAYTQVISLGRRKVSLEHAKLEQHLIDFERLPEFASLFKAQDVFCCLGTTIKKAGSQEAFYKIDFTYAHESARIAQQNGAKQFLLVSALGADAGSRIFYNRVKGELEAAVSLLPFKGTQIFRPSLLLGQRAEFRRGEQIAEKAAKIFSFAFIGPLKKYRPIHARDVARAMLSVAKEEPSGVNIFESEKIHALAQAQENL